MGCELDRCRKTGVPQKLVWDVQISMYIAPQHFAQLRVYGVPVGVLYVAPTRIGAIVYPSRAITSPFEAKPAQLLNRYQLISVEVSSIETKAKSKTKPVSPEQHDSLKDAIGTEAVQSIYDNVRLVIVAEDKHSKAEVKADEARAKCGAALDSAWQVSNAGWIADPSQPRLLPYCVMSGGTAQRKILDDNPEYKAIDYRLTMILVNTIEEQLIAEGCPNLPATKQNIKKHTAHYTRSGKGSDATVRAMAAELFDTEEEAFGADGSPETRKAKKAKAIEASTARAAEAKVMLDDPHLGILAKANSLLTECSIQIDLNDNVEKKHNCTLCYDIVLEAVKAIDAISADFEDC